MADDLVREVKDCVEASEATYKTWRKEARETLLMKAGVREAHWPGDTASIREGEGLPALVVNQLPQFSQRVTGAFRLNQFAISLTAAEAGDQRNVETMEGLIRAIQYDSMAKVAYRFALQNAADTGLGWLRVVREYEAWDAWDQVLQVAPVPNPFCIYPDAASRRFDLEDCMRLAVLEEIPKALFLKKYPGASTTDMDGGTGNLKRKWTNEKDETVTVAEYWRKVPVKKTMALIGMPDDPDTWETLEITKKEEAFLFQDGGQLYIQSEGGPIPVLKGPVVKETNGLEVGIFSGAEELEKMRSEPGRYLPFVMVLGEEVHVDGERRLWGLLHNAKEPQRIWNYQWSAAVESVMMQGKLPYTMTAAMIAGYEDQWQTVNQQRMPYALYNIDPAAPNARPRREAPPVTPVAALALVEKAEQMLNSATGVNAESLGEQTNAKSGVAINARQQIGNVVTAVFPDNLTLGMEQLTRVILERVPIVYDRMRTIRILGKDFAKRMPVTINGPGQPDLTKGRYDVLARIGPSFVSQEEAQFAALSDFGKTLGPEGAIGLADQVAAVAPVPDRTALVERVKVIQGQMGFSPDGQPPPKMMDSIMQAIQGMLPTPQQLQQVVVQTIQSMMQPPQGEPTPAPGGTIPQGSEMQ